VTARRAAVVSLAVLGALLSGCAASSREAAVTLRVLNWAQDLEWRTEQAIADRWAASRPGVAVIVESITSNYSERLTTSIAAGTPPDVFLLDNPDIPMFAERGLVLDLAPYAGRVGYDAGAVFPEVMEIFERGTRIVAFPKGFSPLVVYYNRRIFRELGIPEPPATGWTWDEFLAAAKTATRDEDRDGRADMWGVAFPRQLYEWVTFVWSAGSDIVSPDGRTTAGWMDAPATVATFERLAALVTQHVVTPPVQYTSGDAMRMARFYLGRQAMFVSGHWQMPRLVAYAGRGELEIGITSVPTYGGHRPQTALYASGWAVPVNVTHKRLAVELAAFLAGEQAQRMRAATRLELPVLTRVAREVAEADTSGVEAAFLAQVPFGRAPWGARAMDFFRVEQMSLDIMDRHLLRGEPLPDVAADVAAAIDRARGR
jgi:multiple sugar transport system substrate-binding protein